MGVVDDGFIDGRSSRKFCIIYLFVCFVYVIIDIERGLMYEIKARWVRGRSLNEFRKIL